MEDTHFWTPTNRTGRKPTVLLDVDGPLAQFDAAALEIVFEVTGRRYQLDDIRTWEIFESIEKNDPTVKEAVYSKMKQRGGCLGIPVCGGAQAGVEKLRAVSDLVIVTSPFWGGETWVYEREKWLFEHFGIKGHEVIHARQKYRVAGDVLIDDKVQHLENWKKRFPQGTAILWATAGNRDVSGWSGWSRVDTWERVLELLPAV